MGSFKKIKENIIFRINCNEKSGLGHLIRCIHLAEKLKKIVLKQSTAVDLANLETFNFPLYSTVKEQEGSPAKVFDLTKRLIEADGMIVCSPEYNGSIPPVITNAIAWVSVTTKNWRDGFSGKKAIIASSSGGPAQKYYTAMKNQLEHLGVIVLPRAIIVNSSNSLKKKSAAEIIAQLTSLL